MINNFLVLRNLTGILHKKLKGKVLYSCATSGSNELQLFFAEDGQLHIFNSYFISGKVLFSFRTESNNEPLKQNTVFRDLNGSVVKSVITNLFDRSFCINFSNNNAILFKLYGNHSNIIHFESGQVKTLFKRNHKSDYNLNLDQLFPLRIFDFKKKFSEGNFNLNELKFLDESSRSELAGMLQKSSDQWNVFIQFLQSFGTKEYYINKKETPGRTCYSFSFYPSDAVFSSSDLTETLNFYYRLFLSSERFETSKQEIYVNLKKQEARFEQSILQIENRKKEWNDQLSYDQVANILMANLHQIKQGETKVTLFDFYHEKDVSIKLKKDLNAQDNAAWYYKKSKNSKKESEILDLKLTQSKQALEQIRHKLSELEKVRELKELRPFIQEHKKEKQDLEKEGLFKNFTFKGYQIHVGKNSENNDELTFHHSSKNDIWLHAKDYSGSHVIIKVQGNKNVPSDVLERAAELAAYYSKGKSNGLLPVIYTERKYVRKPKGAAAGAVRVEKEKVLLVEPKLA